MAHPKEDSPRQGLLKEELMTKQWHLHWLFAQIVVNSIFITPCALPAVIIVARSLSRKRRNHSACDYEPHRSLSVLYRRG